MNMMAMEIINGLNLYVYCDNNPVNLCDHSGHLAISTLIFAALIGGAISVGTAIMMGAFSTTLDGVLIVSKNRLTKSYFNKGRSNLSKKDN